MISKYRIAILGDSISQGIGNKKVNYIDSLQNYLGEGYYIKNFAYTGTTISYAMSKVNDIKKFCPNIILIMYGNVDAQLRPNINGNKYHIDKIIPRRYKLNGMLDPRPFYSKKWYRILPDRIDNINRKIIRKIVTKTQGLCQWVGKDEFCSKYQEFLNCIKKEDIKIFLVSTIKLDDKYYPGCDEQYKIYNREIEKLAKINNCKYIDLYGYISNLLQVNNWNDIFYFDHYHPNAKGYELIAKMLSEHIINDGGKNE